MIMLYFIGIIVGIVVALLMSNTFFKGDPVPFVMELPNYRMPGLGNVARLLWDKAKDFLQRAFTVIFVATIVIWFLQTFDVHMNVVTDSKDSLLACISGYIAPLFEPLGFGDWRVSTALITGFMAKESVVATLSVLFGGGTSLYTILTPLSAMSLLVFCLLYTPCVAAIASIKRELGGRWAIGIVIGQCCIAWIVAFIVKLIGLAIGL
jgi:ferrous iron transport protein B